MRFVLNHLLPRILPYVKYLFWQSPFSEFQPKIFVKSNTNFLTIPSYFHVLPLQLVPSHNIAYYEKGNINAETTLLCISGLTRNAKDFNKLSQNLDLQNIRLITVDLVGRGNSDYFTTRPLFAHSYYNELNYYYDIYYLIQALDLKNVNFIGTSLGGIIGMLIAALHPELVSTLILNDIGPFIKFAPLYELNSRLFPYKLYATSEEVMKLLKDHLQLEPLGEKEWQEITNNSIEKENEFYRLNYDPQIPEDAETFLRKHTQDINLWFIWQGVKCPVLLIRGKESTILSEETAEKMIESKKGGSVTLYQVDDAGHAPSLNTKEQIDIIGEFLTKYNFNTNS